MDRYYYKLDLGRTLTLKIYGGREVKLKLLTSINRIERYRG
ncbi:MAG: hypothetical protein QXL96_09460 [Ignisphaera sp.]